jgi:hypothetical protein
VAGEEEGGSGAISFSPSSVAPNVGGHANDSPINREILYTPSISWRAIDFLEYISGGMKILKYPLLFESAVSFDMQIRSNH